MNSMMTSVAEGNQIIQVISQFRVCRPGFYMMNVKFSTTFPTLLTSEVVFFNSFIPGFCVNFFVKEFIANRRISSFPVPMIRTTKASMAGERLMPHFFHRFSYCLSMFFRHHPTSKSDANFFNRLCSRFFSHHLFLSVVFFGILGNFLFYLWMFSDVIVEVFPSGPTRASTKFQTPSPILFPTLETYVNG